MQPMPPGDGATASVVTRQETHQRITHQPEQQHMDDRRRLHTPPRATLMEAETLKAQIVHKEGLRDLVHSHNTTRRMHTYALTHTRCTRPFPSAPALGHRWALVPCHCASFRSPSHRRSAQPSRQQRMHQPPSSQVSRFLDETNATYADRTACRPKAACAFIALAGERARAVPKHSVPRG